MNVLYLLKYLWKRKWLIIIPTVLVIVLAWWFSRNQAAEYTSVAELSTGYMEVNPLSDDSRARNNTVLFNNVLQTLQSNQVLDQVSYSLLLHDMQGNVPFIDNEDSARVSDIMAHYPGGKNGLLVSLSNKTDSFYVLDLARKEDRIIRELAGIYGYSPDALLEKMQVNRIEGSDFIKITTTTTNAGLSAFISNEVCRRFLALYQSRIGLASNTSLDSLRSLTQTKLQILNNKRRLLKDDGDLALSSGSVGLLGMLQGHLSQQNSNLIAAQVALDDVNKRINASGGQEGGQTNNGDVLTLQAKIGDLYTKYVNGGSSDTSLLHQIDRLRNTLQQKLSSSGGGSTGGITMSKLLKDKMNLEVKVTVARQTMKDVQYKINSLKGEVQSSAARQGVVQGIQNEIEIARQEYEDANKLKNEAMTRNMFPGNNFKQVLHAGPPIYPNPSKKIKIIGFAGVGVFFFVVFLLLFFEFIDPNIKTPSYLKANVPFPLLANFKNINTRKPPVEEMFAPDAPVAKSQKGFRKQVKQLRYEVQHAQKKILLMAGTHEGSGRTTLMECLAGSLGLSNQKVLLIDANFHNNTLTRKYEAKAAVETFKPEGDQASVNREISAMTVPGKEDNIRVIGCDSGDYTPGEILPKENIFTTLKENEDYDYVLIDCASLSQGPDCKELLRYVDGVILAFAADQTLTEEDKKLIDFLKEIDIETLGVVLNKIPVYSMDL